MTADDRSEGSGSSEGSAGSLGIVEKSCSHENNVRARVGLYMKDGDKLRADFHVLYRVLPDLRKKKDRRKIRRKAKSSKHHKDKKKKGEVGGGSNTTSAVMPILALPGNPSSFAVYAHVRGLVLENAARQAQTIYLATTQPIPSESDTDDESDKGKEPMLQIPKMVGLGLVSVYELIRGSVSAYPALCIRALEALLDILQGQQPEALRVEPPEVIDALFNLLLRLATASNGDVLTCPSSPLVGVACACLLSLVVARGETGKFLRATADILMTSRQLASQSIQVPVILTFLQRSVHAVLLGKTSRPDWLTGGVPKSSLIDKFSVKIMTDGEELKEESSMTCDGHYLYIHNAHGLFKIGSGFGGTMKGHIYMHRPDFYPKQKGWLGFAHRCWQHGKPSSCIHKGDVFYRPEGSNGELVVIDREVLKVSEVYQCSSPGWCRGLPFSDGINIGHISPDREDGFVVRTYNPLVKPMPLVNELSLSLAIRCIQVFGGQEQQATLSTGIDEDVLMVVSGKEFTLVRTSAGRIHYSGKASSVGMKQGSSNASIVQTGAASSGLSAGASGCSGPGNSSVGVSGCAAGPSTSSTSPNKWPELSITKSPRIIHVAVGHEGQHAVLVSDEGAAFFVGTARRGEDGDASKGRRQPKPVKPKKMIKLDGQFVITAACNNGTSALVTRDGELYMFGKDTLHCDNTGLVTEMREVHVASVALGKAHAIALTNKGQVYSFGINNKGQCGRDYMPQIKEGSGMSMSVGAGEDDIDEDGVESEDGGEGAMCAPGRHRWVRDHCLVCTICHECTGYGAACVSSGRPNRNSGQPCGCGSGDSGCGVCGCCRSCADEIGGDIDQDPFSLMQGPHSGLFGFPEVGNLGGNIFGRACGRLQDQLQRRLDERRHRPRHRNSRYAPELGRKELDGQGSARDSQLGNLGQFEARLLRLLAPHANAAGDSGDSSVASTGIGSSTAASPDSAAIAAAAPFDPLAASNILGVEDGLGSDQERDASKIAAVSPARVILSGSSPVVQVACGLHHSVVLCSNGETYTWGSNSYGQLGVGDLISRGSPVMIRLPPNVRVTQVASGSNHTVFLTSGGQIYTCGDFQKGQLGRLAPQSDAGEGSSRGRCPWYSVPGVVPGIGPRLGRRATWVGASADVTYVKLDQSLINAHNLSAASVVANSNCLVLLPVGSKEEEGWKCLVISRSDGQCRSFSTLDQICFAGQTVCLDPVYNVLWSYDNSSEEMRCYNIVAAEAQRLTNGGLQDGLRDLLSPELSLPILPEYQVSRAQVALHMLSCIDTVTWAHEHGLTVVDDDPHTEATVRVYTREDFTPVNRFESHGGGWGYSGHSIEAIRFMCDTDVLVGGFGLFGGRGEYMGKIKLFELGVEGGDQETDGDLLAETEEMPYECGARQKYPMLFDEPVPVQANKWYVAWARVSGPSSDCGSSGQSMVTTEDQVIFYFKSSKKSNNGTDVNAGQIPQLLYRITSQEGSVTPRPTHDTSEPAPILSKGFFMTVRNDVFQSLLDLLGWAWATLRSCVGEQVSHSGSQSPSPTVAMLDLQRLVYICCACLRLLRIYINEVYPNSVRVLRSNGEKGCLAESVADVRGLLRQMLSDPIPTPYVNRKGKMRNGRDVGPLTRMVVSVLDECHKTFVSCFHAFYPTGQLKWTCLCDLLFSRDAMSKGIEESHDSDRLLSAVLASLCSPTVKLRATFPILSESDAEITHRPSPADNAALSTLQPGDLYRYPLLVEHMTCKTHIDNGGSMVWTFREVLDRLLGVVCGSVRQALRGERVTPLPALVHNTCLLLAATVAELSAETNSVEGEVPAGGRVLHITPSRFTRTSQSRTWNTGNGSPDAICFSVDRPGIVIAGVCVYGGVGTYDYELEVMDESGGGGQDPSHTLERWSVMEIARGTFGPDDSVADIVEIKFERPVPVKESVKYAIRLCNHGGRTSNGDGGLGSVKGPDGTTFTFSACSLSVNGTNHIRGQIPHIMYYSTPQDPESQQSTREIAEQQARKSALAMVGSIVRVATELMIMGLGVGDETAVEVLGSAPLLTMLLPLVLSHVGPLATSDPRSAVSVLGLIQEILPHVAALNNLSLVTQQTAIPETMEGCHTTTSNHYAWVESDHPYRPASVANYRVSFPSNIQWMTLEFDPQCGTAQPEDSLQVYVPCLGSMDGSSPAFGVFYGAYENQDKNPQVTLGQDGAPPPYWAVLNKFSGSQNWPHQTVILPGHEIVFSLETASDYVKDERANTYGFRVLVVGYEWPPSPPDSLRHLEKELSYLGGLCAASLIKKDLCLPPVQGDDLDEEMELVEDMSLQVYRAHPGLLSKGFALSHPPTIHQTLDGVIPFSCHSNERLFLRDFVSCAGGTSGGRLARWLQPDSYVDVRACEVLYSRDDMRAGWPAIVTIVTRDQYNEVVHVPSLKVEVVAVPVSTGEDGNQVKLRRVSQHVADNLTFGGHPQPSLDVPYQVSIKDKMCYCAITMIKAYENYSFEELRYMSPAMRRPTENMLVRSNNDGTYSCNWTPGATGWYSLHVTIDSYQLDETYKMEVKDPPQGVTPPVQSTMKRSSQQPSRLRKFVLQNSAGLRIRTHPSLQSEQIGIVHVNGTIAFIDEVHNSDGVWLRLSAESIRQYCTNGYSEAWCLQYNQHIGKTLLVPVDHPKTILDQVITDTITRRRDMSPRREGMLSADGTDSVPGGAGVYTVVKCGASGHNIRSQPSLKAPPVGMLVLGNSITADSDTKNNDGTWVRLDSESTRKYCFTDGEAWSLAVSRAHTLYLQRSHSHLHPYTTPQLEQTNTSQQGFDFTHAQSSPIFRPFQQPAFRSDPFVFGAITRGCGDGSSNAGAGGGPASRGESCKYPNSSNTFADTNTATDDSEATGATLKHQVPDSSVQHQGKFSVLQRWMKDEHNKHPTVGNSPISSQQTQQEELHLTQQSSVAQEKKLSKKQQQQQQQQQQLQQQQQQQQSQQVNASLSRDVPPELQGVSVKDLVKAIGESRANGNGATPPRTPPATPKRLSRSSSPRAGVGTPGNPVITATSGTSPRQISRSSSPVPIPGRGRESASSSPLHSSPRAAGVSPLVSGTGTVAERAAGSPPSAIRSANDSLSDTSAFVSSLTQDMSHSPSISSLPTSTPSTPRREPLSTSPKTVTQTATQTSPEAVKFNIGSTGSRDENLRLSPKMTRKDRSGKPHRSKRDRAVSPVPTQREKPGPCRDKVKEAMSPSVAECMRAIFAAFLWHEGIVHDAMACASYLKFHPDLSKQGTFHWKPRTNAAPKSEKLTKEQKARQRHSVEVSTYTYLNNVTLQNTEDLLKTGTNANINEVPHISDTSDEETASRATGASYSQGIQGQKLATVMEGGGGGVGCRPETPDLPPVLYHVVLLWEELTSSCLKAVAQQIILPSPTIPARLKKMDKVKDRSERDKKKHKKKSSSVGISIFGVDGEDEEGVCELCGTNVPSESSEQHFRTVHPGCGGSSKGCGYVGTRWKVFPTKDRVTQPCGEVVRGCFHMCLSCRNRHKGQYGHFSGSKCSNGGKVKRKSNSKLLSPLPMLETHVIMRNNAMFLLDLASAATPALPSRNAVPRKSPCTMPCVSELSPDNSPFPKVAFQCLHTLNCQQQHLNQLREDLLLQHTLHSSDNTDYRSSSAESRENNHRENSFSPPGASHQESPASDIELPRGRPFHRSISVTVATSGQDWSSAAASASASQHDHDQKAVVVLRKRNNSSGENAVDSGSSSLLVHPSAALERLAACIERGSGASGEPGGRARQVIIRPIMAFIFQNHDLETLAYAMRHATRKAAARVYAMQALNWLLRSVTQPTCLHDLLWCFVAALTPSSPSPPLPDDHNLQDQPHHRDRSHDMVISDEAEMVVLEHPLSDVTLAGDAVHPLPLTFHQLLQTVADLMMLLPPGSPLQMMAVRCWGLRFTPADHDFLHQSHVFSNISKILSRSEEVLGAGEEGVNSMYESHGPVTSIVECLCDLMSECEIRASSRQAMVPSLTDSSTETFWESGDEDRNKTKALTLTCPLSSRPKIVYVHIDNCRDLGNKVSSVSFKCGCGSEDMVMAQQVDVESRFTGWLHAVLPCDTVNTIVIELKGPDQSVRVRQVRVLGGDGSEGQGSRPLRQHSPITLQHRACEQETLKVFRLITGQVFGRLISTGESSDHGADSGNVSAGSIEGTEEQERNNDLREHMVGILFSRSKLTHLQKQVCAHIVQAIRKEAVRAREEWEAGLSCGGLGTPGTPEEVQHNPPDTYCFEMLSMVLALSGSAVGRAHLAQQDHLLKHLLSLLHTGSARVQRQVVALFRRMLADVPPQSLALILGVESLPAQDYAILHAATTDEDDSFDIHKQGLLDVFLAVIAKALTVQLKTKGKEGNSKSVGNQGKGGVNSVTLATSMPTPAANSPRWWLQGSTTQKQADLIISLVRDMTAGKLSDAWAKVSKGAIAENIVNLTRLSESERSCAATCLATPTLWLALASLCVLHPDHVDALSSQHWQATTSSGDNQNPEPRPTCENHDDGETLAMILCEECSSNLCGECDRILHLHRRTRHHHRTVFRQEQEAIKVDLHEGCGRTKLFWLLALADSTTLKAMLELRGENQRSRGLLATSACRFCGSPAQPSLLSPAPVCQDPDCQEYSREACTRSHECGHLCGGLKGESSCLPCLHGCSNIPSLKQDADDMCMICFSEALSAAPAIQLECGHVFHAHCCRTVLTRRWPGPRITFTFSLCPICKVRMSHWVLTELLGPIAVLFEDVRRKALMRLEYEGLHRAEAISTPGARYYNEPAAYAMDRYAYYVCFKCNKAYYGGEARCDVEAGLGDDYDPRELVCGACSDVSRAQMCPKHGTDFLEYKCRYCCSVAVFFCFGTTHFCNACHDDFQRVTNIPKAELPHCPAGPRAQQLDGEECPLHVQHPPTGEEFALGCGVCRNAHTF
ncbi:E3 ubiquitin-protein ligase MYCBP2-like isoform X5 [Macrobrachium nipponense]|uniref:E3 ubiquitin-protein ligase MYCBP2-like isoform X5 n=1 Tax=Macrobrachium nipponense TaxID=159736 RepID=UPI0030C8BA91